MKRISIILVLLTSLSLQAQQQPVLKNKRGILILPQRGDFCIGASSNPFFQYFGNMFNGTSGNNAPVFTFMNPSNMIFVKYMKANDYAYRAGFRFGINNSSQSFNVKDMSPGADQNATLVDVYKTRSTNLGISGGIEKRRGSTRLQGIYGVEGFINFNSSNEVFEFGNKLENLDTGIIRVKKNDNSSVFTIGFRGFAGVEYFLAPNFSIGGELGFGPSVYFRSSYEQITEQYDFTTSSTIETTKQVSPKSRGFRLDTDNYNGIIKLLFYF